MDRVPKPGEFYKHFKNKLYQIITIASHSETMEKMVVYQALYGDYQSYVRPLSMFASEVDHNKYPEVQQKYRFELVNNIEMEQKKDVVPVHKEIEVGQAIESCPIEENSMSDTSFITEEGEVNKILLEFLDANSYEEKLTILSSNRKHIDDKLLNDMAVSLDCTVEEGLIEDRINGLRFCLQTLARFETNRLR